jgi:hypothetical protein
MHQHQQPHQPALQQRLRMEEEQLARVRRLLQEATAREEDARQAAARSRTELEHTSQQVRRGHVCHVSQSVSRSAS